MRRSVQGKINKTGGKESPMGKIFNYIRNLRRGNVYENARDLFTTKKYHPEFYDLRRIRVGIVAENDSRIIFKHLIRREGNDLSLEGIEVVYRIAGHEENSNGSIRLIFPFSDRDIFWAMRRVKKNMIKFLKTMGVPKEWILRLVK